MPVPSTDELVRRYQAGESTTAIGASIGVSATTVRQWLMQAGVTLRPPGWVAGRQRLDLDDADLIARYRSGETLTEILNATGIGRMTVRARLKRAGVAMRPACEPPGSRRLDLPVAEIVESYRSGESSVTIGRSFGVSSRVIRQRLIEAGVERRRPGSRGTTPNRET
jgi:hypothetical protein